jgi:hypothetical protein
MMCPTKQSEVHSSSHTQLHPHYLDQSLGFWVTCDLWSKNDVISHGWGWEPPQTAFHIHIRHIKCVWAHSYAVHWHTSAALHSYTHPTLLRLWGFGSLVESTWCHYIKVEAKGHLKLLPLSTLEICNVFEHIDMLSIGIHQHQQSYTVMPILLSSDFGVLGHLWSQNDVNTSWLRMRATSNCFPIHIRHRQTVWAHWHAVHWHTVAALHSYTHPTWLRLGFWVTCGVKMMSMRHGWGWEPPQTASSSILDI